jgi:hypothetical protein
MGARKETDLYEPIKQYLVGQGYEVRGEVTGCDLVAVRDDEMVVVELKTHFNLALLFQGIERQKRSDAVYLAVEAPRSARGRWQEVQHLCRRLGLGLITVLFAQKGALVEVVLDPGDYTPRHNTKRHALLLREFQRRSGDYNTGGSIRRPLVTAYREEALRLAAYLKKHGPSSPKNLRAATGVEKAAQALQGDAYGWFRRVEKGIYELTPKGEQALLQYADVVL